MSQEKKPDNSKRLVEFAQLPITASAASITPLNATKLQAASITPLNATKLQAASKKGTAKPPQNVIVVNKEGKVVSVATSEKPFVVNAWEQKAAERLAAARLAAEEAARLAARLAAERLAAEEAARLAARLAAERLAAAEAARRAAEEAEIQAAEVARRAAEEAEIQAAEVARRAAEEAERQAAEVARRAAAEEAARRAAEEAARRAAEKAERQAAAEDATRSFYVKNKAHLRGIAQTIIIKNQELFNPKCISLIGGSVLDLYSELSGIRLGGDPSLLTSDYDITIILNIDHHYDGINETYLEYLKASILPMFEQYYREHNKTHEDNKYKEDYDYVHHSKNIFIYKNIFRQKIGQKNVLTYNFKIVIIENAIKLSLFDINFVNYNPHDKLHQYLQPINIININGLPVPDPITYIKIMMHTMISRGNNATKTTRIKCIKDFKRLEYFINKRFYKTSINVFKPRTGIFIGYDRTKQIKDYISDLQKYYSNLFELLHIQFPWCNSSRNIKSFASVLMAPASAAAASSDQQATPVESFKYSQDVGELYFYIENPNPGNLELIQLKITKLIQPPGKVGNSKPGGGKTIEMFHHCY